ncbi:hypothetical protein GMD78_14480 [Ornithinibacillus sp. L9]|uniref:Uncharacterized protein n=1 Tax=Ornithinibacillus caprae TaxID=2678566 RepID=A0A6N8FK48_9BACI|nr:hypothetical protein [Ornithinibacillus caprae]MUK89571.1 hypothetical protein [Ornithinibacillus caprae]
MKKRYVISALGAAGFLLSNKNVRQKLRQVFNDDEAIESSTILNAGIPDQISSENEAQLDNAKMVSEGSSYGVHYYNDTQQEEAY